MILGENYGTLQPSELSATHEEYREARGRNYGRLLMQKAEQSAREKGIEVIALEVAGNNRRARDLFKDLGYETIRRTMQKRLR